MAAVAGVYVARKRRPAAPTNVLLREGAVRRPGDDPPASAAATLTGFDVDNGPDLLLYRVAGPARSEGEVRDFVDLGC